MDYIEIMLRGYTNENDQNFLGKYFIREFRKAEKEHYDLEEFFTGLLKGIDTLKNEYQIKLFKRQNELYLMLEAAENGTLKYGELKSESAEERRKKTIEYCKNELTSIGLGYSKINLLHFTNSRFIGHLQYSEVEFIGNGIAKAYRLLNEPQQIETVKPKKLKKTLFEFIHKIEDKKAFKKDLKEQFPTEIGKSIKAIIDILSKEQILIYGTKEFKQLFEELENCFSRDIGTYNSVQNVKTVDAETTDIILKKLNPLIIKHKTT